MTFDEILTTYWTKREELRELQGQVHKKRNEIKAFEKETEARRKMLDKEIDGLVKKYNTCRLSLVDTQGMLKPELDKEVASHPVLDKETHESSNNTL